MKPEFEKHHLVSSYNEAGDQLIFEIGTRKSKDLVKVASEINPEVQDFIDGLSPEKNRRYILINALGAMEYYGSNINADAFPESGLMHEGPDYGYKTYEMYGYFYMHHRNKDPEKKIGDIHLSVYNPRMHRIELITSIIENRAPEELISKIDNDDFFFVSMGSKNPFDICSICGNKATKLSEHCEHVRTMKNKILPDGRKVMMINPYPRFHDISYVITPAEMTARTLKKIASINIKVPSTEGSKDAELSKEIPGGRAMSYDPKQISQSIVKNIDSVSSRDKDIDPEILKALSKYPIDKVLATLLHLGVVVKPDEFTKLSGLKTNETFAPTKIKSEFKMNLGPDNTIDEVAKIASTFLPERSYHTCYLVDRYSSLGSGERKEYKYGNSPTLSKLAAAYGTYRATAPMTLIESIKKVDPIIMALIVAPFLGLRTYLRGPKARYNKVTEIQKREVVKPASVIPDALPPAFFAERSYIPVDKTAALDFSSFCKTYKINLEKIAKEAETGADYIGKLEKIAGVNLDTTRRDMDSKIAYSILVNYNGLTK